MILAELLAVASRGDIEPGQVVVLAKVIEIHRNNLGLTEVAVIFFFLWPGNAEMKR